MIPVLDELTCFNKLVKQTETYFENYYAFYSSLLGGIVKNPRLMLVPLDDHMVHRGDGVFEAIKVTNRAVYLLDEHLERLYFSAAKISLNCPLPKDELKETILETLRAADQNEAFIRVFLSRGPGNFSTNPYNTIGSQLYIAITKPYVIPEEKYLKGVTIGSSHIPVKTSWMTQIKTCNYLSNVLMQKEAIDRKLDYVIGIDDEGNVTEGPTENLMIVNREGVLVHPHFDNILKGITMLRVNELAKASGILVNIKKITVDDILLAKEVILTGTTLNVLPVVAFDSKKINDGSPGEMTKKLNELLHRDITSGPNRTIF